MPWPRPSQSGGITNRVDSIHSRHLHRSIYCDGNYRVAQIVRAAGYDVLDIGFYMRNHALHSYRISDGVHWDPVGTRIMTQLLIGHLTRSWDIPLTKNIQEKLDKHKYDLDDDNWAANQLKGFDTNTLSNNINRWGSYAEIIQERLRSQLLDELKVDDTETKHSSSYN
uniref:SGNH_hydro domain-containing protein n=1 Tax=Heterorhabditis bacteriophora TaxID=37862 RepID=A0A1I7WZ20_HETBA